MDAIPPVFDKEPVGRRNLITRREATITEAPASPTRTPRERYAGKRFAMMANRGILDARITQGRVEAPLRHVAHLFAHTPLHLVGQFALANSLRLALGSLDSDPGSQSKPKQPVRMRRVVPSTVSVPPRLETRDTDLARFDRMCLPSNDRLAWRKGVRAA